MIGDRWHERKARFVHLIDRLLVEAGVSRKSAVEESGRCIDCHQPTSWVGEVLCPACVRIRHGDTDRVP